MGMNPILAETEVERVQLGEETSYAFIGDVVKLVVEQWNFAVAELREQLNDPAKCLALIERETENVGEAQVAARAQNLKDTWNKNLLEISLKHSDSSLLKLCCKTNIGLLMEHDSVKVYTILGVWKHTRHDSIYIYICAYDDACT